MHLQHRLDEVQPDLAWRVVVVDEGAGDVDLALVAGLHVRHLLAEGIDSWRRSAAVGAQDADVLLARR